MSSLTTTRPLRQVRAHAPAAAFAVTSILFFLGLIGAFVTAGLVVVTSSWEPAPVMAAMEQIGVALLAAFAACALGGLGGLVLAGQSRAGVDADGWFRVQSWPPGKTRALDLADLTRVESRRGPLRRRGLLAATRHSTTLLLRDGSGRVVQWNPAFWRGSEPVVHALRDAVLASDATLDAGAIAVLQHPPFGPR